CLRAGHRFRAVDRPHDRRPARLYTGRWRDLGRGRAGGSCARDHRIASGRPFGGIDDRGTAPAAERTVPGAVAAPRPGAPQIRQTRRILRGGRDPVVALGDLHGHRHRDRIHREPGRGGLVTLKDSGWVLSLSVFHQPEIIGQPPGTSVWWGYGLYPERNGDF